MWGSLIAQLQEFAALKKAWYLELFRAAGWTDPGAAAQIAVGVTLFSLLGGTMILLWLAFARRSSGTGGPSLANLTRWPRRLGYAAFLLLIAGFGGWSSTALLASAAIAPAVVSPDGSRKTIQHLEGGIVRAIHVREGDWVVKGQKLVTLEDIQARGGYDELRERYVHLLTMEARLIAEQTGAEEIGFPEELRTLGIAHDHSTVMGQRDLLHSRRATQEGRERILAQRVKQLEEEISGLHEVVAAQDTQLTLIGKEIEGVEVLYGKGLERLPRLLALQRERAKIRAEKAANRARIARDKQEIGETEMQLLTLRQEDKERANEELTKVRAGLAELRSQLPSRTDVLSRTVIAAPIAGTVMNVRVTTEAGVVGPGEPLLDIVPSETGLIVDARVKPIDIDTIRPGMRARVLLTAYRQRNLPQVHGILRTISADRLIDDRSGEAYFLAKVEVDRAELGRMRDVRLSPGMPAEVMILTGEQTLLDYLLRPLLDSLTKGLRED
ncbi:HlyD family type I secretion periplasmic adaptor subunit [Pararhizobium sp. LjRoot238]|uniref:HlyD family type I secretion periplasmic adaptor subunit n=1 Tax=Pararhizobium sp. LjRoot238 TaxID=3342293 RepID=UPI003ED0964A